MKLAAEAARALILTNNGANDAWWSFGTTAVDGSTAQANGGHQLKAGTSVFLGDVGTGIAVSVVSTSGTVIAVSKVA